MQNVRIFSADCESCCAVSAALNRLRRKRFSENEDAPAHRPARADCHGSQRLRPERETAEWRGCRVFA